MKNLIKLLSATMAVAMLFSFAGCGKNNNGGNNGSNESMNGTANESSANKGSASEDYFEWSGNMIVGLTDSGAKQTSIVIPARCEGFEALIFTEKENSIASVSFESDKNIELNGVFKRADKLTSITLPAELEEIGTAEFWYCTALKEINIPATITNIAPCAFQCDTALETVTFAGNPTTIGDRAFEDCSALKSVVIPNSVTLIGERAFYECTALESIALPASLTEVKGFAFGNSGLQTITVPESVQISNYDVTAFAQKDHGIAVNVVEGSWMDQNFDSIFEGAFTKNYSK